MQVNVFNVLLALIVCMCAVNPVEVQVYLVIGFYFPLSHSLPMPVLFVV